MFFSELIQAVRSNPQAVTIPAVWGQGRTVFGGVAAAMVYAAMREKTAPGRPLRSLAISFVGPLAVDTPVSFEVEVLREGKSVSQVLGRAVQNGQVMTLVQGSFGASRESSVKVASLSAPPMKAVQDCVEIPYVENLLPAFTRYMAMSWGEGSPPFSKGRGRAIGGWIRFRETPQEQMDETHLLALVDAWPPATLSHLAGHAPNSSLTWTIEFVQPFVALTTDDWCLYRAEIEHAQDGYGHIAAGLWGPGGELIAMSRQSVTIFG